MLFRNFYLCARCGQEWTDVWPAQCDDDCPFCGARHMSPYKSEDVSPYKSEDTEESNDE
jgi:DNA-directed RNA polymerase subunit RPC12/RpoP